MPSIRGVLFDMDGVLVDTEPVWESVRREFAERHGGRWTAEIQTRMMGARTEDWSRALSELTRGAVDSQTAASWVIDALAAEYRKRLPVIDGAAACVRALASEFRLGLVSGSPLRLVDLVLDLAGLADCFEVAMAADEVAHGKPAPDPYRELARRLGLDPHLCAAVEDSANGIRSGHAAGARVVAIPRGEHRPDAATLALAASVLDGIGELTPALVRGLATP